MIKNFSPGKFLLLFVLFFLVLPLPVLGVPIYLKSSGDFLYMIHREGTIEVWDKSSGLLEGRFSVDDTSILSSETDGTNLYVGSTDNRVFVIDLTGQILKEINISSDFPDLAISSIAIDKDSQFLYTGSYDNIIRVWDMRDWSLVKVIEEHKLPVNDLVLDGRYLYSASGDGSVKVF